MSVDSLQAYEKDETAEFDNQVGIDFQISLVEAPLGFGEVDKGFSYHFTGGGKSEYDRNIKTTRVSNTHYEYSISFSYDISTSTDPNLAGHASDVIIGGGADLIVSEAIQGESSCVCLLILVTTLTYLMLYTVALSNSPPRGYQCVYTYDTYAWQPAHTTTFVLPVYEIEQIISSLNTMIVNMNNSQISGSVSGVSTTISQLQNQRNNWQTVLRNYRAYNSDFTPMFNAETIQFNKMVNAFSKWRNGAIDANDFTNIIDNIGISKIPHNGAAYSMFKNSLLSSFKQVQQTCSNVIPSYRNTYVSAVCDDFDASNWHSFSAAIYGACVMPEISVDDQTQNLDDTFEYSSEQYTNHHSTDTQKENTNPLSQSKLVQQMCQERVAVSASQLPGTLDVSSTPESMFGFLKDKTKYLTFGASTSLTMSWTTTITDSLTTEISIDLDETALASGGGEQRVNIIALLDFVESTGKTNGFSVTLGKSEDSSHTYERTVSVTFQDNDVGKWLV